MNIESIIFKRATANFDKLKQYGFIKEKNSYVYKKLLLGTDFKAIIDIDVNGKVSGKVIDLQTNEEYLALRVEISGEFVNKIKELYKNILLDIKNNCFDVNNFISPQANRITKYIKEKYNNNPEFLWGEVDGSGVFRNTINKKWYGIIMNVDFSKIDNKSGFVEILNVKLDEEKIKKLINKNGYYKAYHMNKKSWISIVLNDTLKDSDIVLLIDESYNVVNGKE